MKYKIFMTGLVLALAYLALLMPVWKYRDAAETLQRDIDTLSIASEPTLRLIDRFKRRRESLIDLIDTKQRRYPMTDVLLELTNLAPDDSWLDRLESAGDRLLLRGESKRPARFIDRLENSPMFEHVIHTSPPVAIPGSFYERFHLAVTLAESTAR